MPWLELDSRTRFQKFSTEILKAGQIPKHVGVIMDGNRRFSKSRGLSLVDGYTSGSNKLSELLRWAHELGIKEITAYAFSIENFKRSELERQIIFRIMKKTFEEEILCDDEFYANGEKRIFFGIRVVGDWSMIPQDLREVFAEAMIQRRAHTHLILNLAVAYTSRNELSNAAECLRQAVVAGTLQFDDVSQDILTETLQILPTHPVDLLIRTSNTRRLSDFLLWQSSEAVLHFIKEEWPELSFWDLWKGIFKFQQNYPTLLQVKKGLPCNPNETGNSDSQERKAKFVSNLRAEWWEYIDNQINN